MDFESACDVVRAGIFAATDDEKLRLYGLYQVARGGAGARRDEASSSAVDRAKRAAVHACAHLTAQQAADEYAHLVEQKLMNATG